MKGHRRNCAWKVICPGLAIAAMGAIAVTDAHAADQLYLDKAVSISYLGVRCKGELRGYAGLVIQVRGPENTCRNLKISLNLCLSNCSVRARDDASFGPHADDRNKCPSIANSATTDMWLPLRKNFSDQQIESICAGEAQLKLFVESLEFE